MEKGIDTLVEKGLLTPRPQQPDEVRHLWTVAERDFFDASADGVDPALGMELAYNAAVKYCLVLVYAEGFRPARGGDMLRRVTDLLPVVMGPAFAPVSRFLEASRKNLALGKSGSTARLSDNGRLIETVRSVRAAVSDWIAQRHADIGLPESD